MANKMLPVMMIGGSSFLVIIAVAIYFFFIKEDNTKKDDTKTDTSASDASGTGASGSGASGSGASGASGDAAAGTTPPPAIFADAMPDIDFAGEDIACHNGDDYETKCKDLCKDNTDCAAYVTKSIDKLCCYKTIKALQGAGTNKHDASLGFKFYVKNDKIATFTKNEKKDKAGHDIKHIGNFAKNIPALTAACSAMPNCKSFNSEGWLKTIGSEGNMSDWSGDWYLKA